jgi:hypothetical protein
MPKPLPSLEVLAVKTSIKEEALYQFSSDCTDANDICAETTFAEPSLKTSEPLEVVINIIEHDSLAAERLGSGDVG